MIIILFYYYERERLQPHTMFPYLKGKNDTLLSLLLFIFRNTACHNNDAAYAMCQARIKLCHYYHYDFFTVTATIPECQ